MPDRTQMLAGLWQIIRSPAKAPSNYFSVGGYAATFLNMALVGFICTGLYCLPGRKANNAATLVIPLTVGFTIDGVAIALCVGLLVGYFNLVGAEFNGIVFGSVFCMLSTCNSGSHPLNIMPIIIGYVLAARLFQFLAPYNGGEFTQFLYSQSIIVGICYANGLSPSSTAACACTTVASPLRWCACCWCPVWKSTPGTSRNAGIPIWSIFSGIRPFSAIILPAVTDSSPVRDLPRRISLLLFSTFVVKYTGYSKKRGTFSWHGLTKSIIPSDSSKPFSSGAFWAS